ncbi:hypothetical protein BWQ96_02566 [Gracilariopsis chorda]|uniref:DDE Tnp4 domain-containing protein n=1 Tax=Gracilariopsis chorda TaxID=448386 RepID=A0A2V3IZY0_9FLOR|nr:hypothetical protein BWQ96_02566 [Gracilariopsis chorda]|eukprot:PXF47704.1 hypothetical protein BWQ96_02566 [Gracilariopsis chorda]
MKEDSDDDTSTAMALMSQFDEVTLFLHKATYVRRHPSGIYNYVRFQDANIHLFKKITHLTLAEFDSLHHLAEVELQKPFDVRHQLHQETVRVPRKRQLNTQEILFFLFDIFGGSNEGNQGLEHMALKYRMSVGSVSNYFRYGLMALHKSLDEVTPRLVRWPSHAERIHMEGLVIGFPFCVFFFDGNKNKRWRPGDAKEQEKAYDGYKKCHCWALLVFCDIFGRFIRVEISDHGAESDRSLYTNSDVCPNRESYLADGQHGMADMGFAGDGELVVPYKRTESASWLYRTEHYNDIRKQSMVNEWVIGFINNRYRLFLGR